MSGVAKNYVLTDIFQGPVDFWYIGAAPPDSAPRLTLASDGTPDSTAHPGSVHLGMVATAVTTGVKPKIEPIVVDQFDAPVDVYEGDLMASIGGELAQTTSAIFQYMLGSGVYSTGSGFDQLTFGGLLTTLPKPCFAAISPKRDNPNQYIVALLYMCVATGGFSVSMGRAKPSYWKFDVQGLADITRTAGQQVGVIYRTLVNASGGTPTAKNYAPAQIYQGPCDLWIVSPAPTDTAITVTIDPTSLTPSASVHGSSVHLGVLNGATTLTVKPKISLFKGDQFDAPIDAFVDSVDAELSGELEQSGIQNLANALGVATYQLSAGSFEEATFGGNNQPQEICVCAIGVKRTAPTKPVQCTLYKVFSKDGITWAASRKKPNMYKVQFSGLTDTTRTAGRQIGVFAESD